MEAIIRNPYKVSHKIYIRLIIGSIIGLILSMIIPNGLHALLSLILDILKNLSYGCIASTLVAWLIDCANVRNLNKKANSVYDTIYADLKFQIAYYIGLWSELCAVAYKDIDYHQEKKTWKEWYFTVKDKYNNLDEKRQDELSVFFSGQLKYCVEKVNKTIEDIYNQRYLLTINDLTNSKMDRIISDFKFEFYALSLTLSQELDKTTFWEHMDAISNDLENYINEWIDISYYNKLKFKPYNFHSDNAETIKAILLEKGIAENIINTALENMENK